MRAFWVHIDVFGISVKFYFGTKHKKNVERILEHKIDKDAAGCSNGNVIWIDDEANEGSLVHEIYHATSWATKFLGIQDEETSAYICAYLYRKTIDKFKKFKGNK